MGRGVAVDPPDEKRLAAMAIRKRFGIRSAFTAIEAERAVRASGVALDADAFAELFAELAVDALANMVPPAGAPGFTIPPRGRVTGASRSVQAPRQTHPSKRGQRAGAKCRVTVTVPKRRERDAPAPHAPLAAQGQGRQAAAPLTADPSVKMIARPTVDGGTSFTVRADSRTWCDQLRGLLTLREREGRKAMPEAVTLHNGDGEVFEAIVRAGPHGAVALEFEDDAQLELYDRNGSAVLITKADALWREGLDAWMQKWFDLASRLLLGRPCPSPEVAFDLGWRTRNVELCTDFTGLEFHDADLRRFVGARGRAVRVDSKGFTGADIVETITLGQRGRNSLSVSTHNKSEAIRKRLGVDPERSIYSGTWRQHEWDGKSVVRRVEVRAAGRALRLRSKEAGALVLDLTRPASLLDQELRRLFWTHATQSRFRLVLPAKNDDDLRHQPEDPRWVAVQRAGGDAGAPRLVVDQTDVRHLSLAALRSSAFQGHVRALARAAGLHALDDVPAAVAQLVSDAMADPAFDPLVSAARASRDARTVMVRRPD